MEDPGLVARLRDEQIALTVCPLSNVALRVVAALGDHMLPGMLDAGLLATVNSDDPAYFGGYVDDNLAAVRHAFGYDDAQLAALARNSFDACFAPEADKQRWKAEVDGWLAASTRGELKPVQELRHDRAAGRPAVPGGVDHQRGGGLPH